ncbi:unnamed protein product (macronuclear) [Paramecium tetraurelia]|uniref:non-specific serine/threonine protein kinase n=1 Tax=Paramecium tetraurelia TaxID=5888 RepID=A0DY24_PARTE|nr:uncharacterized protein GSPATT00021566001 [Paramecium tetraurelia]CAK87941.1 unnamed protein product [Paramecium tetraurelia]|eukprot:XP_001455338.1 hypothetical protein (macronuclear) [Paramecium tetraurelia strain d4-2]
MQLQQLEKAQKLGINKYLCIEKKTKKEYILTLQASSDYDDRIRQLDHQNFLIIVDRWQENGMMCIIQNSEPLQTINGGGCFGEQKILSIILQLAQALNIAELKGIQATVTLQNLLLDEYKNIKIDLLSLNATPLNFASPEVLRKESTHSGIWSIGIIGYFLANNRMPFNGDNDKVLAYNIIYKDPQPTDQSKFPILSQIIKLILVKNIQKRYTYQQLISYLTDKVHLRDTPSSLMMNQQFSRTISKKEKSICSFKESKIEIINESDSERNNQSQFLEIKPVVPQIITLDTIENMHSVHRQLKNRPQSSVQRIIKDDQKDLMIRLQRIRPNSAVGFSGKEYISKNIKQELSNRRIIKSSVEPQVTTNTFRNNFMKKQQFKEVSVDLKEAKQIKNEHVIRVYNLEYQNEQQMVSKRIHKPFQKVLQNPNTPKCLNQKEKVFFDEIQDWKSKMQQNMKQQQVKKSEPMLKLISQD